MRARALAAFKDGQSGKEYRQGDELELTKARFEAINKWTKENYHKPFLDEVVLPPATGKGTRAAKGKAYAFPFDCIGVLYDREGTC